jgi:hypothetical protein
MTTACWREGWSGYCRQNPYPSRESHFKFPVVWPATQYDYWMHYCTTCSIWRKSVTSRELNLSSLQFETPTNAAKMVQRPSKVAPQLIKIFPTFYGIWKFLIIFHWANHLFSSSETWIKSVPSHYVIILPCMSRSSTWSVSIWFPH